MAKFVHKRFGLTVILLALLVYPIEALGLHIVRGEGDESFTVLEGKFSVKKTTLTHLFARETGHAILNSGAKITRLVATGHSEVEINEAAETTYIEADDKAIIRISDGVIGYLIMNGNSQAHIKKMVINGTLYPISGGALTEGGIVFSVCVVIHVWADDVSFEGGRLKGKWAGGEKFSILLAEHKIAEGEELYEIAKSLPQQIQIHKAAASDTRSQAPAKISESQVIQPSDKITQTQTEQQSIVSAQDDKIFIKGCPEPILSDNPFKSKKTNQLYNQAFEKGYEMALQRVYKSKLDPDQILENPLINQSDYQQPLAWYYGWRAGRWYGVAQATGHGCIKRMSPWPIAPLKIRYAFFREAMKSSILNTYGFSDAVFMLGKESKPYCEKLLPDILNDENIEVVEPLSKFENTDHPALVNYRSCDSRSALHFKYDDFNRINPRATTFSKIGTQAFRFYGDLRLSENTIAKDVIYCESEPYFAGYSALNSQSCELSILATNNPTTFRVSDSRSSLSDNFLIKWRGKYINLEAYGDPPYTVRADSLAVREESHIIECDWVAHAKETAEVNPWGGKPVLRSIIKDKTKNPGSDKGSKASNRN